MNSTGKLNGSREEILRQAQAEAMNTEGANPEWRIRAKLSGTKDPVPSSSGKSPCGDTDGAILGLSARENLSGQSQRRAMMNRALFNFAKTLIP
jgi:hypothetical protein